MLSQASYVIYSIYCPQKVFSSRYVLERSLKVTDIDTTREMLCDFQLVSFPRYSQILVEMANFYTRLYLEFRHNLR